MENQSKDVVFKDTPIGRDEMTSGTHTYKALSQLAITINEIDLKIEEIILKNSDKGKDKEALQLFEGVLIENAQLLEQLPHFQDCKPLIELRKQLLLKVLRFGGNPSKCTIADFGKIRRLLDQKQEIDNNLKKVR
jgi:hypothetical protein